MHVLQSIFVSTFHTQKRYNVNKKIATHLTDSNQMKNKQCFTFFWFSSIPSQDLNAEWQRNIKRVSNKSHVSHKHYWAHFMAFMNSNLILINHKQTNKKTLPCVMYLWGNESNSYVPENYFCKCS